MLHAGEAPVLTQKQRNARARWQAANIRRLMESGDVAAAHAVFDALIESHEVHTFHVNAMMALGTSDDAQQVVHRACNAGLSLDASPFNDWISKLQLECRATDPATSAMRLHGVRPDEHTRKALSRPPSRLSILRTVGLKQMIKYDHRTATTELFDRMVAARQANGHHAAVMIARWGVTNEEAHAVVERVEASGVALELGAFTTWLTQMQLEGKPMEPALDAIRARGMASDERVQAILKRDASDCGRMRTVALNDLFDDSARAAALRLFHALLEARVASEHQLTVMMTRGIGSSDEVPPLIEAAEDAGVALGTATFNAWTRALQLEGRALAGVTEAMSERGIEADDRLQRAMARSPQELSKMRTAHLARLVKGGDLWGVATAVRLYEALVGAGQADAFQLSVLMKAPGVDRRALRASAARL